MRDVETDLKEIRDVPFLRDLDLYTSPVVSRRIQRRCDPSVPDR